MKFFCIADEDTVRGFRLAGIEGRAVETPREAADALARAAAQAD
ncbi:MAG: ATP synthase subunit F, partial [Planctomycetes bacterium]|nr:ATP synthase subunit F [Planctomycetota bacterium]